jgi:PAS domain S-box-containing protein
MPDFTRKTLLLVEDEAILAMNEKLQLESYGYAVKVVSTGEKAVEAVKAMPEIDLVLMDINLGKGIDGTEAADIILRDHDIPIVFVSSHSEREIVEKTEKISSYGYVVKNLSITVLDASIKMAFKLFDEKRRFKAINTKLEVTLDAIPDLMFIIDREGYYKDFHAEKFSAKLALQSTKIIGSNIRDIFPPEEVSTQLALYRACIETGNIQKHNYGLILEGVKQYFTLQLARFDDTQVLATVHDITDLITVEDALRASEERFQLAMDASNDGLFDWNLETNSIYYSPRWKSILGYKDHEVPNDFSVWETATAPEDVKKSWELQRKLITGQVDRFVLEFKMKHKLGHWVDILSQAKAIFDTSGKAIRIVGTHTDITERKVIEEALRESERKYRILAESMSDVIWVLNTATRRFSYISPSILKLRGLAVEEAINEPLESSMTAESLERVTAGIEKGVAEYLRCPDFPTLSLMEIQQPKKGGDLIWVEVAIRFRRAENGEIEVVGVSRDIDERKKEEKGIKETKDKFLKLFDQSPYPVMILDSSDGSFYDVNEAMEKGVEYSREELLGKTAVELGIVLPGDEVRARKLIAESGQFSDVEVSMRTKSGKLRVGLVTGCNIEINNRLYLFQTVVDITERKKLEAQMMSQRRLYEQILEQSLAGYWDWDIATGDEYLSPMFKTMFGYEDHEIENRVESWQKLIFEEDLPSVYEKFNLHSESKGKIPYYNEVRYHHRDGSTVWVICTGKVIEWGDDGKAKRMIGCHIDITERKRVEDKLNEKSEKYRFALEGSNLGEWDWDYKTGIVTRNERWAEMLGYTSEELDTTVQQGIDLMHPDDIQMVERAVKEHIKGIVDHYYIEYRLKTKSGNYKWIRDCGKIMVRDAEGNPVRLCGTHEDVDERKRIRDRVDTLLAEKELILKEVHHRIKNNMNTISGLLSLQASTISDPNAGKALEDAGNRIRCMSLLYDKLYRSTGYSEVSVKEYLHTLVDDIVLNFPNSPTVRIEKDLMEFELNAKKVQPIGIIVNELLTNIMKYAFKGKGGGLIRVSAAKSSGHVAIFVEDDGIGMPEFTTFENSTGFGLRLVKALAQQLDGTIRIEQGRGTKVVLEFDA